MGTNQTPVNSHDSTTPPRWTCDKCHEPLSAGDGYLLIRYADIDANTAAEAAWDAAHPADAHGWRTMTMLELVTHPDRVRWAALHRGCDPNPDEIACYWVDIDQLRTWRHVAGRTAHLITKEWLPQTDWTEVLYRAGAG